MLDVLGPIGELLKSRVLIEGTRARKERAIMVSSWAEFIIVLFLCYVCPILGWQCLASHNLRKNFVLMGNPNPDDKFSEDNNDFITKIFGRFMPKPEDVGLNRYTSDSLPENFPATKTEWASELSSDTSPSMKLVRQTLARTNLEDRKLKLAYSGSRDGFSYREFHKRLDAQGPAVVLCRTTDGSVFGGYNPCGWVGLGEARGSIAAFLFYFPGGDTTQRPVKLCKIAGAGMAQMDDDTAGPKFGPEGLTIPLQGSGDKGKFVRCKLGLYYERAPTGGGKSLFIDQKQMSGELEILEVFTGVWPKGERIPYSGAMFFQVN